MSGEHSFLYIKEEIEASKKSIEIKNKKAGNATLLYPRNIQQLDYVNVVPFYQSIKPFFLPGRKVILSLAKIESIDSQGLALLVQLTQLAKKQKCYFALTEVPPPITRILRITEIDKLLVILSRHLQTTDKTPAKWQKSPDANHFLDG